MAAVMILFLIQKRDRAKVDAYVQSLEGRCDALATDSSYMWEEHWVETLALQGNDQRIDRNLSLIGDSGRQEIGAFVNSIIKPHIVLRFSYLSCEVCVDSALSILKKYENTIGSDNIVVWATYNDKRDLDNFRRVNGLKYKTYFIASRDSVSVGDRYSSPYVFVVKPRESVTEDVFFPLKENPARTNNYFDVISSKYYSTAL